MQKAVDIGFNRWAFSLDGSTKEIHDAFRGTAGSYDLTIRSLKILHDKGMPLQINTTVSRYNLHDLPNIVKLLTAMGVNVWSVFFLVPTGRGKLSDMITPEEHEQVLHDLAELRERVPFDIKTTAAPFFRRVLAQRSHTALNPKADNPMRSMKGITDGKGFVFISHIGDVYPSGFLPIKLGNVREKQLSDIYRNDPTFRALRNPDQYNGKCGVCEYRHICGGSRARAYAVNGDYLGSDPACPHIPQAWMNRNNSNEEMMKM